LLVVRSSSKSRLWGCLFKGHEFEAKFLLYIKSNFKNKACYQLDIRLWSGILREIDSSSVVISLDIYI
jgi:hypothetical protein